MGYPVVTAEIYFLAYILLCLSLPQMDEAIIAPGRLDRINDTMVHLENMGPRSVHACAPLCNNSHN